MITREPDRGDVDIVLKLYELRREKEMRKARKFIGDFQPTSVDDVKKISDWKHKENAHFRQVMSYWAMVADFANRGLLHPDMFATHCGEALFIYAKFEPLLPQIRAEVNPLFLSVIEKLVKANPAIQERVVQIRAMMARVQAMPPAKKAPKKAK
jgi:hypothetical protein